MSAVRFLRVVLILLALCPWAPMDAHGTKPQSVPRPEPAIGQVFDIDVSELRPLWIELGLDERVEQSADWAVFGTLVKSKLDMTQLRNALYDKLPLRLPELESVLSYDYGSGRRVMVSDDVAWLFVSAGDSHPQSTIARLADQLRTETGRIPSELHIYRFRAMSSDGVIRVERHPNLRGEALLSPQFGYVSALVRDQTQFLRWLSQIDDVTHVRILSGGQVELGGRRFPDQRTPGARADDVAALYQAYRDLASKRMAFELALGGEQKTLVDAYKSLENCFNSEVRHQNEMIRAGQSHLFLFPTNMAEFATKLGRLESLLTYGVAHDLPQSTTATSPWLWLGTSGKFGDYSTIESQRRALTSVAARVKKQLEALNSQGSERARTLLATQGFPKDAPGFSLDPQWNVAGIRSELQILLQRPQTLIDQARKQAKERHDVAAMPLPVAYAKAIDALFTEADVDDYKLTSAQLEQVRKLVDSLGKGKGTSDEDGRPLAQLIEDLTPELIETVSLALAFGESLTKSKPSIGSEMDVDARLLPLQESLQRAQTSAGKPKLATNFIQSAIDAARFYRLLAFIDSRNGIQCARYDGPLQGTAVGMSLFYTDLLAKLWLLDYERSAPQGVIPGFKFIQNTAPRVPAQYWAEMNKLNATRVWFGPRAEGYSYSPENREINLSHISTRVYAAGSDSLHPHAETVPSESNRQIITWWDRHYAALASLEPQFHLQNQIMKWSIVTGLLSEQGMLPFLATLPVERSHRFDHWYREHAELRFRGDIRMLEPSKWPSRTECMERLRSYSYEWGGGQRSYIEGGVSLPKAESLLENRLATTLSRPQQRGAIKLQAGLLKSARETLFRLQPAQGKSIVVMATPGPKTRLRGPRGDISAKTLKTQFTQSGSDTVVLVEADRLFLTGLRADTGTTGVKLHLAEGRLKSDGSIAAQLQRSLSLNRSPEATYASAQGVIQRASKRLPVSNEVDVARDFTAQPQLIKGLVNHRAGQLEQSIEQFKSIAAKDLSESTLKTVSKLDPSVSHYLGNQKVGASTHLDAIGKKLVVVSEQAPKHLKSLSTSDALNAIEQASDGDGVILIRRNPRYFKTTKLSESAEQKHDLAVALDGMGNPLGSLAELIRSGGVKIEVADAEEGFETGVRNGKSFHQLGALDAMTAHERIRPRADAIQLRSEVYEQVNWADQARVRPERPYRVHGPRPASQLIFVTPTEFDCDDLQRGGRRDPRCVSEQL